jgi:hypothetical protein
MNINTLLAIALASALLLAPRFDLPTFGRPLHGIQPLDSVSMQPGNSESFSISGKIDSIDYASNVMVVKSRGDILSIVITPTTTVERDGEIGGVSDLRRGALVAVKGFIRDDGAMVAVSIVIKAKADSHQ